MKLARSSFGVSVVVLVHSLSPHCISQRKWYGNLHTHFVLSLCQKAKLLLYIFSCDFLFDLMDPACSQHNMF